MATAIDVAKYILEKKIPGMTTMKLQKLTFYSQAYSLAWTEEALFEDDIFAWKNGPVIYNLFNQHRGIYLINSRDLKEGNSRNLTEHQKIIVDSIVDQLGTLSADQLRERTHKEDPWINARRRGTNEKITKETLREYYSKN